MDTTQGQDQNIFPHSNQHSSFEKQCLKVVQKQLWTVSTEMHKVHAMIYKPYKNGYAKILRENIWHQEVPNLLGYNDNHNM
jgi:hypothetical protein